MKAFFSGLRGVAGTPPLTNRLTWKLGHWGRNALLPLALVLLFTPVWLPRIARDPLSYRNLPFPVVTTTLEAGQTFVASVHRCNNQRQELSYTYTRQLTNQHTGVRYLLAGGHDLLQPGCAVTELRLNVIPSDLPPGVYILSGVSTARGRWKTVDVPWETQPFTVTVPASSPAPASPSGPVVTIVPPADPARTELSAINAALEAHLRYLERERRLARGTTDALIEGAKASVPR